MTMSRRVKSHLLVRWLAALFLSGTLLMSGTLALAAAPGVSAVTGATFAPIVPLPSPSVATTGGQTQIVVSANWSGYSVDSWRTGKQYISASGEWTVPAVTLGDSTKPKYSGTWIGIGGDCANSQCTKVYSDLIQVGTEEDVTTAGATYNAWYEMLPQAETPINSLVIHPGDVITAFIQGVPLPGTVRNKKLQPVEWFLSLTDLSTLQSWSKVVSYNSSLSSAEWIEEAPTVGKNIARLADFGLLTFDPVSANGANPYLMP
ncbi:MAG TPA: G1 family glutamic endopeptidase, partial [Thermomicrobiaceae bacterium]|nr:G1 family glutamic endopeptidase [Thermomicrobiaceae bacterium]